MSSLLERLKDGIRSQAARHRNRAFLEATMAAAALVSHADGEVSLSERIRVDQILERLDQLKIYDPHLAVDLFNEVIDALDEAPDQGRETALARIKPMAKDPDAAHLVVRICCAVSEADGEFSPAERRTVEAICSTLGVTYEDCLG